MSDTPIGDDRAPIAVFVCQMGRDGRRRMMRRLLLGVAMLLALGLAGAPAASARVTLVATGTPELVYLGIPRNEVVARLALPGISRAVAITRDGTRGYVTAGGEIVAVDVNTRLELTRSVLGPGPPEVSDIELSPGGETLYVVRGTQLLVLDAQTLASRGVIELRGLGGALAISNDGGIAAVALATGRVAMVELGTNKLLRLVKLKGAFGVAIADGGETYVSAGGKLRVIARGQRKPRKRPIKLPTGAGGGLTLSPARSRLIVAAAPGGGAAALVDLRTGVVRRLVSGTGPGRAAWYPDASRILFADGGSASVSLISPFSRGRIGLVTLPGTTPSDLVVQPGVALIQGTDGPDVLTGTRGADRIEGLGGDDKLNGGRDRDVLEGAAGADQVSGGASSDSLDGGEGDDFMIGGTGDDELRGGVGDDGADGGTGNDTIQGDDGDDTLDGGDGDDTILGGPGNDVIVEKGFGDDKELNGGPGNDTIRGGRGSDQLILGEDGDDQLFGESGSERIRGGAGNDLLEGGAAGDRLEGEEGDDTVRGDVGNDSIGGGNGNDTVDGGTGDDAIMGEGGNDTLIGGTGVDRFNGGPGDDIIRAADDSADVIDCGEGVDTVFVEADTPTRDVLSNCETVTPITAEASNDTTPAKLTIRGTRHADRLTGTPGEDSIFGRGGADKIFALEGDDYVDGDQGDDQLHGGPGNDLIPGRQGHDQIWGDEGDDRITGDRGNDRIFGGAGNDTIFGNIGEDTIDGGPGNDRINMVDRKTDRIVCGPGSDIVFADVRDKVAADCESVRR
jgi:Ca2+-binding RTX toxin-like protein